MTGAIGDRLDSYVPRQARERALNHIAEARDRAQQILDQATAEADAMRASIRHDALLKVEEQRRQAIAQAELEAKQTVLGRREELIQRLWKETESRLLEQAKGDPSGRVESISRLVADAAAQLSDGPLEIQVAERDRPLLTSLVLEGMREQLQAACDTDGLAVAQKAAPIWGGVIVRRTDTNQLVDNSLDYRLALVKRVQRDELCRLLMPWMTLRTTARG